MFILGPSHYKYFKGAALPSENCTEYLTPFGGLPLDVDSEVRVYDVGFRVSSLGSWAARIGNVVGLVSCGINEPRSSLACIDFLAVASWVSGSRM